MTNAISAIATGFGMSAAVMLLARAHVALAPEPEPDHFAVAVRNGQWALLYRRAG